MPTKIITIKGETFEVSQPYTAGHSLTDAEARALNQMRLENIRNNMAKAVEKARAEGNVENARVAVADYDREYSFSMPGQTTARVVDPVEREARSIAKDAIKAKLANEEPPRKLKDVDPDKLEAAIAQVAASAETMKLARKNVRDKQSVGESLLSGVDLTA